MVHTLPDYTTKYKMTTIFGQIDQGELAARLKSINTFDRRGDTVWMDDFEAATLAWQTVTIGTGAAVAISTTSYKSGSQSLKLTAGSTTTWQASANKLIHLPPQSLLGFECSFSADDDMSYFLLGSNMYDGTNRYSGAILYDHVNDHIDYLNSGNTYTQIASGIKFKTDATMFMPLKFVMDYTTGKYVRMLFGDTEYDLSDIAVYSTASANNPYCNIEVRLIGTDGNNPVSYVDNVIFTQNEV